VNEFSLGADVYAGFAQTFKPPAKEVGFFNKAAPAEITIGVQAALTNDLNDEVLRAALYSTLVNGPNLSVKYGGNIGFDITLTQFATVNLNLTGDFKVTFNSGQGTFNADLGMGVELKSVNYDSGKAGLQFKALKVEATNSVEIPNHGSATMKSTLTVGADFTF